MLPHHDHRIQPAFSDPQGTFYSLPIKPPFSFEGMTARVFPLRANLDSLQRFVNGYLNIVPAEVGRFRAVVPYVYLMMLDYGKLALEVSNLGWLAQKEIMFCVPLEWYRVVDGRWVFHDWATVTPFIYVDDDLSMNLGRTVYGWPKTIARLTPSLTTWMENPVGPITEATASTLVFPELYHGRKLEARVFLEVMRQAPLASLQYPFDPANPVLPWTMASQLAASMAGFGRDVTGMLAGMGIVPLHDGSSPENFAAMASQAARSLFPLRPNLAANTLNLKQFRRTENPDKYCFQALTNGPMRFTALNRFGLLGEDRILLGDASGGYTIRLHDWPSLPIVETLGLEVARRWRGSEVDAVELKPALPFWYDCNMEYLPGVNVVRRSHDGVWHEDATGKRFPAAGAHAVPKEELLFNTTVDATTGALAGPFRFFDTTVRVLPLLARPAVLQKFLDEYINRALADGSELHGPDGSVPGADGQSTEPLTGLRQRFRLWSAEGAEHACVYLTATSIGTVTSKTNNVGDWAEYELSFLVPVRREQQRPGSDAWETIGVGVVPAFTYVDDPTAAAARTEVLGIPTNRAAFELPPNTWMASDAREAERQSLLRVDAEVLPAIGEGQRSELRTIVDIRRGDPAHDLPPMKWRVVADRIGDTMLAELGRRKALQADAPALLDDLRVLALELLGNHTPIAFYTLKQFRDVPDPDRACYQALVCIPRVINEIHDLREIETPITVRIHEFPTQPIMGLLGIVAENLSEDADGIVWAAQPVRPFEMRVTLDEHLGLRVLSRSGGRRWHLNVGSQARWYLDDDANIGVGPGLLDLQESSDPRRLEAATRRWNELVATATPPGGEPEDPRLHRLTVERVRAAVERVDPQVVIEQLLSREWGSWDGEARWVQGREQLERRWHGQLEGVPAADLPAVARRLVESWLTHPTTRPGEPDRRTAHTTALAERLLALIDRVHALDAACSVLTLQGLWSEQPAAPMAVAAGDARGRVIDALGDYLEALRDVAAHITPSHSLERELLPSTLDSWYRLGDLHRGGLSALALRVQAARDTADDAAWESLMAAAWAVRRPLREAGALARGTVDHARESLLLHLARDWQKPDFVVRRDVVGPERERIFPRAESWDATWYAGPSRDVASGRERALASQRAEARRTNTPVATPIIKDPDA